MNTITHKLNGVTCIRMSDNVIRDLRSYSPQGCPFIGYTLYNLLQDLIGMYNWKIDRGYTILIYVVAQEAVLNDLCYELKIDDLIDDGLDDEEV